MKINIIDEHKLKYSRNGLLKKTKKESIALSIEHTHTRIEERGG